MSVIEFAIVAGIVNCGRMVAALGEFLREGRADQLSYLKNHATLPEAQEFIEELAAFPVRATSMAQLQAPLAAVHAATTLPELERARSQLTAAVHQEQQYVAASMAPLVEHATQLSAFEHVEILRSPDRVLVVGQDEQGRALQTELLTPPGQALTLKTETLGFHGSECQTTLDQFQQHLAAQGVTLSTTKRVSTLRQLANQACRVVTRSRR